jgi:predicted homoserine dehydrogenase-like protein
VGTWSRFERLTDEDVNVAITGAGFMGRGLVHRLSRTGSMRPTLVVNRTPARAVDAYRQAGWDPTEVLVSDEARYMTGTSVVIDGGATQQVLPPAY